MLRRIFIFFLLVLQACTSRDISPKGSGTEYFPLKAGIYWVYSVSETTISQVNGQSNALYEMKIQIVDSIASGTTIMYKLQRYTRADASQPWVPLDTWSASKDQFQAVLQEGNIPYIKLSFPLVDAKSWNGNALNNLGGADRCLDGTFACDNYQVVNLGKPFQGSGVSYDDSVTILENNLDDPIVKKDIRISIYAKSVGLVSREITTLEYCTVGSCIGQQIVENGYILKQILKDYGSS